jgi:outer membrane protein assembly factor BamB
MNTESGKPIWDWYDIIEERTYLAVQQPVILDNHFIWAANYWNYCIDLNTGQTVWKNTFIENYDQRTSGLGDKFIGQYNHDRNSIRPPNGGMACVFSKDNGKPYYFITPKYDTTLMQPYEISNRRGEIQYNKLFMQGIDTLLLLTFVDPPLYDYYYRECLALYNLTKKNWVYDRAIMLGKSRMGTNHAPCLYQGKVYTPYTGTIVCNDLMTGKKLWQSDIESGTGFATTGLIVAENRIYGNSDDGYLYSWDIETGQQIFRVRTSGTGSRLNYLNGILYFTGAGDGKLHAVEAATGKYFWKLDSPDKSQNKQAVFSTSLCAVIPGKNGQKGKVIALTGLNAYCYEAER